MFYELKHIRQNIRDFIEDDFGYEAVLSEYDSFPVAPNMDTINNCFKVVEEITNIMVLIVGGRYGYVTNHGDEWITNLEYLRAKMEGIVLNAFQAIKITLPQIPKRNVYNKNSYEKIRCYSFL